jgi:hypothetical protein
MVLPSLAFVLILIFSLGTVLLGSHADSTTRGSQQANVGNEICAVSICRPMASDQDGISTQTQEIADFRNLITMLV